ncbi:hypothetical protein HO173_008058 [Letharia columbiana]|uniref:Uncharacterized protein n=1 Tax=Letharia columbiana TaxID=112416 RepID=A0A8H6L387_9LECA|nr:uncharacterized protein HO173_008058 [Letharia columbiana]KAF6233846.1 hypothetical protein HO173_008058 [Letharia columbiana]
MADLLDITRRVSPRPPPPPAPAGIEIGEHSKFLAPENTKHLIEVLQLGLLDIKKVIVKANEHKGTKEGRYTTSAGIFKFKIPRVRVLWIQNTSRNTT